MWKGAPPGISQEHPGRGTTVMEVSNPVSWALTPHARAETIPSYVKWHVWLVGRGTWLGRLQGCIICCSTVYGFETATLSGRWQ